eukprot:jgi/Tetstr1/420779/TSEL_011856.t1
MEASAAAEEEEAEEEEASEAPPAAEEEAEEHCTAEKLQEVGQWCYDNLKLVISEDIYLQTEKGVKKLNVSAESWHGATCRLLLAMDNFKNILEIAIDEHEEGEVNRDICLDALTV